MKSTIRHRPFRRSGVAVAVTTVVVAGGLSLGMALPAQAATPTVTCSTSSNIFNTGYDAATAGILPDNAIDANWTVAGPFPATVPENTTSLPPVGTIFGPANVGNIIPAAWSASPYGNAQWISQQTAAAPNSPTGDWYYKYDFTLDPAVVPGTFALKINFLADNDIAEVFVNGVAQSPFNPGLPSAPASAPSAYNYAGFTSDNAASTVLNHNWQLGPNTIIVQMKSTLPEEGFDAQVLPSVLCPPPSVSIAKSATVTPAADQAGAKVGDTIAYSYLVTNTGMTGLTTVAVSDPGLGTVTCPVPAAPGLDPGAAVTCTATATHTVTQADVDAGSIADTATATGTDAGGTVSAVSAPSTATVAVVAAPAVSVVVAATVSPSSHQGAAELGDTVAYSYTVTNIGNVTLKTVAVSDPTVGAITCPVPASPGLAPGASEVCTADALHTVTQADIQAADIIDVATATGTDTHDAVSPVSAPSSADVKTAAVVTVTPVTPPATTPTVADPPQSALVFTGFDATWPLGLGIASVLLGLAFGITAWIRRRRRGNGEAVKQEV
jgi:hypothetical protein